MKVTKKILSLTLALIMTCLAFAMPVSAAGVTPLVMVNGIGSTDLYLNYGTEDEKLIFSGDEAFIEGMVKDIGGALLTGIVSYGVNNKDYNKLADRVMPAVNKYVADLGFNPDGTPVNDTIGFFRSSESMATYTDEQKEKVSKFAKAYADKYGEEYVYDFTYDWRDDPVKIADELANFISDVKVNAGCKRVNMVAMSMGAAVALAYMSKYGGNQLNNVVFASPAWQGTSLMGNIMTNNIELDVFAAENYLVQVANVSATTHIAAFIISFIASWDGLSREYFGDVNAALQGILPRAYTDTLIPYFAGMPGMWSLVPAEYYEAGKDFMFEQNGVTLTPEYEAKIDAYHNIQMNAKSIVQEVMADGARFNIVCGYNCQIVPVSDEYYSSDGIVDTKYMSGGATCAKYLQSNKDWGKVYTQAVKDGHNHVSWDGKVDASTAMFPEQTWFIKNLQHNSWSTENGSLNVVMWLLAAKKQMKVTSDKENYPQFFLYNTYKRTTKAMVTDKYDLLGDVNFSGAVMLDDARLGLKFASGQKKPSDDQLTIGDIDETGEFETEDVRSIMKIAAGIDY